MYKNAKKKIDRGVAFPTCVSVNNTVGHFSPLASDETVLEEGDMLKMYERFFFSEEMSFVCFLMSLCV